MAEIRGRIGNTDCLRVKNPNNSQRGWILKFEPGAGLTPFSDVKLIIQKSRSSYSPEDQQSV